MNRSVEIESTIMVLSEMSRLYRVMANEIRLLILALLYEKQELGWSQLKKMIEKILGKQINPNLLAFHLRYLVEKEIIIRSEMNKETKYILNPGFIDKYDEILSHSIKKIIETLKGEV